MKRQLGYFSIVVAMLFALPQAHAASAIAIVDTDNNTNTSYGWSDHARTLADAKADALNQCAINAREAGASPKGCHVVMSQAKPGYWAIYNADDGTISASYSPVSQQTAINQAWNGCQSHCHDPANHIWHDDGSGRVPGGDTSGRYTYNCDGSECVRHYASGKVVHFTACMNPSTHQPFDNLNGSCSGFDVTGHAMYQ